MLHANALRRHAHEGPDAAQHPGVAVVSGNVDTTVAALRAEPGRNIWLFGGGSLFASLLAADLVDDIEMALMPVLLGGGTPLVSSGAPRSRLTLARSNASPRTLSASRAPIPRRATR